MDNVAASGFSFAITDLDVGPDDLQAQLPLRGRVSRLIPGPDRPDYVVAILDNPITYQTKLKDLKRAGIDPTTIPQEVIVTKRNKATITVTGILFIPRFVGQQFHQGMVDSPVSIAYILNPSVFTDESLTFDKALPVGVGFLTHTGD